MSELYKYPRTFHLPTSLGFTSDDKVLKNTDCFKNKQVVITEKMDGENTTWYNNYNHARSLDSNNHSSRNFVKGMWGDKKHEIPEGWRICGENLYAKHSIQYKKLNSYFLVFSIWDENNDCLSWGATEEYCNLLGLHTVPVLYKGIFDEKIIEQLVNNLNTDVQEGFVIRNEDTFNYSDFSTNVAKWVRKNHIQTDKHWTKEQITANKLK